MQVDEIWWFIGAKQKNVPADADPALGLGDCYALTAVDPSTKLVPCSLVGFRTAECAEYFMADLPARLTERVQLTTDALSAYPKAVSKAFGDDVDYAVLGKTYEGGMPAVEAKRRYSPAAVVGCKKTVVCGSPKLKRASTSHVERANMSMRMWMRRFTRLTSAFSKKTENHMHAISFYFMVYNYVKVHGSVKTTPAIAVDVADFQWTMEDIMMIAETVTFSQSN